ncbi:hypothetical protein WDW89_06555 [Deltaproteobacteria bacterium TL4]
MMLFCKKFIFRSLSSGSLLLLSISGVGWAYSPWEDNAPITPVQSTAKIKVNNEIREIPVFHLTQENCIFTEAEVQPEKWTGPTYKQPECVTIRDKRVAEFSNGQNPPKETKVLKIPANQYFKVEMTISKKMGNRKGEEFGFQINNVSGGSGDEGKTVFVMGGWKPGETKMTKAIKLEPGKYYWRCPQNRTPWYGLIAE